MYVYLLRPAHPILGVLRLFGTAGNTTLYESDLDSYYGPYKQGLYCYSGTTSDDRGLVLCVDGSAQGRSFQVLFNIQNKVLKFRYFLNATSEWQPWSSVRLS